MLHIIYGPEPFLRREALQKLKAGLDTDGSLQTNTLTLDGRQTTAQEIMGACDTAPFLGEKRLVIVEELFQGAGRAGRAKRSRRTAAEPDSEPPAGPWQPLVDYVDRMPASSVLVLIGGEVAAGNPLLEALQAKAKVERCAVLGRKGLPLWISQRARAMGLKLEGRSAGLLADLTGDDLWALSGELEKLKAYAGDRAVREEDIRLLVSAARKQMGYSLADAVVEGKPAQAMRLLHRLLEQGDVPQVILSTVAGRFRRLAIAREMIDTGATGQAIGRRLQTGGFALEKLLEQAPRYPLPAIRAAYDRLIEAELDVKRGVYDETLSLELLVQDLAKDSASGGSTSR
jgi:DNA polymerase-3 subunit delta